MKGKLILEACAQIATLSTYVPFAEVRAVSSDVDAGFSFSDVDTVSDAPDADPLRT